MFLSFAVIRSVTIGSTFRPRRLFPEGVIVRPSVRFKRCPIGMHRFLIVLGVVSVFSVEADAQNLDSFEPFRVPGREAACEVGSPLREHPLPSHTVLSLSEGEEMRDQRLIDAGYDSSGVPLWLTVQADELLGSGTGDAQSQRGWRVIPHAYFIRFGPGRAAEGFHVPGLVLPNSGPAVSARRKVMSAEAITNARQLVDALWRRRCAETLVGA